MTVIKLVRSPAPAYLSATKVVELTDIFKATGSSVWNHAEIKESLLEASNSKCSYCETKLDEESKYLEVEHFEHKDAYPDKVVVWGNLLASCKRCNGAKGDHDVSVIPLLNPCDVDPRDHLGFRNYRLRSLTLLGRDTIEAIDLNNSERLVKKRFLVGEGLMAALEVVGERYGRWRSNGSSRSRNLLLGAVEGVLLECCRKAEYAALAASVLHSESDYLDIRNSLVADRLWTVYLEELHEESKLLVLRII